MNFSRLDWIVLGATLLCIILYGVYKSRASKGLDGYFLNDRQTPWWVVMLSIMGTQASAVTFYRLRGRPIPMGCVLYNTILACHWP
ncbi:hypothetical protein [Paraflavitalea speifideaquila]|uniref:hypothetical protein n=1 Tax=Paraflavitalea speifideaquila TaxID=3076558 RepID=UPI0028EAC401|nr:hypothetical protein [Paraflavitalea speifideiaquila]